MDAGNYWTIKFYTHCYHHFSFLSMNLPTTFSTTCHFTTISNINLPLTLTTTGSLNSTHFHYHFSFHTYCYSKFTKHLCMFCHKCTLHSSHHWPIEFHNPFYCHFPHFSFLTHPIVQPLFPQFATNVASPLATTGPLNSTATVIVTSHDPLNFTPTIIATSHHPPPPTTLVNSPTTFPTIC